MAELFFPPEICFSGDGSDDAVEVCSLIVGKSRYDVNFRGSVIFGVLT